MSFHNRSKGKPVPPNPFWTDMSETGIARRKKVLGKVKDRIERSATPPPEPKDVPGK
jgi:hypothetical protein